MFRAVAIKLALATVFLGILGTANVAEAKGFMLITYGDDITHVADLPADAGAEPGLAVGYKYSSFGVFWLDIWRWGGEFVVYKGDNYQSFKDAGVTVKEMSEVVGTELNKPWSYRLPPGLIILILLVGGYIAYTVVTSRKEARIRALIHDDRYQHAIGMLVPDDKGEAKTFDEAVQYLVDQRIQQEEARRNLAAMLEMMTQGEED